MGIPLQHRDQLPPAVLAYELIITGGGDREALGHQAIEKHAEGVDVGGGSERASFQQQLWCHVQRGTGEIFGTPYYMSPEQSHGHDLDERSDLYSLGVIFYEMLTRRKPYVGPNAMAVLYMHGNAPVPTLQGELAIYQPLLDRLLAKDPVDRFGSARELMRDIARLQGGGA